MTIPGNMPPYYPSEPIFNSDDEDEKIQSLPKKDSSIPIENPDPKLSNGGINYVW